MKTKEKDISQKTSLKRKISSLLMVLSLTTLVMSGIITLIGVIYLRMNTASIKKDLGYSVALDSQQALESLALEKLSILINTRVGLCDSVLMAIQEKVFLIAYKAGEIINNPERFLPVVPLPADERNHGIVASQFLRPENVPLSAVRAEANLMGNIQDLLEGISIGSSYAKTGYIGMESGMFIITDTGSGYRANKSFDPRVRPWYILGKESDKPVWTDVYLDAFDRGELISCAMPFFDRNGNVVGVAAINMYFETLVDLVKNTKSGETGFALMLNENGDIIISENGDDAVVQGLTEKRTEFSELFNDIMEGKNGIQRIALDGREFFFGYSALEALPWHLVTVIDVMEIISPALNIRNNIIRRTDESLLRYDIVMFSIVALFLILFTIVLLVARYVSKIFAKTISEPIMNLTDAASKIAEGNFSVNIDIKTGDEIEVLGASVNKMTDDLHKHLEHKLSLMIENHRISAELDVANKIQLSMLPCIFPAFPDRDEIDIFAMMKPAKEVGGDFYDFFFIDDNTLAIVIADVSEKGVPSALVMVIAKTLIKSKAQAGLSPKEVFESVNNILNENNDAAMFVTAFLGYLDLRTGVFKYVNAGHNPSVLVSKQKIEQEKDNSENNPIEKQIDEDNLHYEWLMAKPDFVLGGFRDILYTQKEIIFEPGNMLFLYTDGITEAINKNNEMFEEEKLLEALKRFSRLNAKDLTESIRKEIEDFSVGVEQSDDITLLVLKYKGK
ncbi:MAG: SpoIIE family protein phosphatase [Candidatus Cloacimonetes bacterium]|nr:SpoIIE family protein phosphatase [Candidatus Cloacimonadota bacterium]